MTNYVISAGTGPYVGLVLSGTDTDIVLSGGTTTATIVRNGATEEVTDGGVITSSFVSSGGEETVYGSGIATSTTVSSGGLQAVGNTGAFSTTVLSGGTLDVAGGVASGAIVSSGGYALLNYGGTLVGADIKAGATVIPLSGGPLAGNTIESGAIVQSTGVVVVSLGQGPGQGESVLIDSLTSTTGVTVASYRQQAFVLSGGTLSGGVIGFEATAYVSAGGLAAGVTVSQGTIFVLTGGAVSGGTVVSTGELSVVGGTLTGVTISGTGEESLVAQGTADTGTTVLAGTAIIEDTATALTVNGGSAIIYAPGVVMGGSVGGTGSIEVQSGGSASGIAVSSGGDLYLFDGGTLGTTQIQTSGALTFGALTYSSGATASVNPTTDLLTLVDGATVVTEQLTPADAFETFSVAAFPGGGVNVLATGVACYCAGTLILTEHGDVAVERLAIGTRLITASGAVRPIRWIGRRNYAGRFLAANQGVQPIRFHAGSLGSKLPRRDLLVSPDHAMFLDSVLIPARHLVNGSTIVIERGLDRVEYFHVELDSHDVLLAEGALSESFVDNDSRGMFHNVGDFRALYPDAMEPGRFCARRIENGFEMEAIRQRLDTIARQNVALKPAEFGLRR